MSSRANFGVPWSSQVDFAILSSPTIKKLSKSHAAEIWRIEDFYQHVPSAIIRSWSAHVVSWPDSILPLGGVGVDPGLNLGLAFLDGEDVAHTLSLRIDRSDIPTAKLLQYLERVPILVEGHVAKNLPVVVEGPAYGARYGQPLLGAVRGALLLGFQNAGYDVVIEMAPKSIRSKVFGDGNIQPKDVWKTRGFSKDAADSLSMAIAGGV